MPFYKIEVTCYLDAADPEQAISGCHDLLMVYGHPFPVNVCSVQLAQPVETTEQMARPALYGNACRGSIKRRPQFTSFSSPNSDLC